MADVNLSSENEIRVMDSVANGLRGENDASAYSGNNVGDTIKSTSDPMTMSGLFSRDLDLQYEGDGSQFGGSSVPSSFDTFGGCGMSESFMQEDTAVSSDHLDTVSGSSQSDAFGGCGMTDSFVQLTNGGTMSGVDNGHPGEGVLIDFGQTSAVDPGADDHFSDHSSRYEQEEYMNQIHGADGADDNIGETNAVDDTGDDREEAEDYRLGQGDVNTSSNPFGEDVNADYASPGIDLLLQSAPPPLQPFAENEEEDLSHNPFVRGSSKTTSEQNAGYNPFVEGESTSQEFDEDVIHSVESREEEDQVSGEGEEISGEEVSVEREEDLSQTASSADVEDKFAARHAVEEAVTPDLSEHPVDAFASSYDYVEDKHIHEQEFDGTDVDVGVPAFEEGKYDEDKDESETESDHTAEMEEVVAASGRHLESEPTGFQPESLPEKLKEIEPQPIPDAKAQDTASVEQATAGTENGGVSDSTTTEESIVEVKSVPAVEEAVADKPQPKETKDKKKAIPASIPPAKKAPAKSATPPKSPKKTPVSPTKTGVPAAKPAASTPTPKQRPASAAATSSTPRPATATSSTPRPTAATSSTPRPATATSSTPRPATARTPKKEEAKKEEAAPKATPAPRPKSAPVSKPTKGKEDNGATTPTSKQAAAKPGTNGKTPAEKKSSTTTTPKATPAAKTTLAPATTTSPSSSYSGSSPRKTSEVKSKIGSLDNATHVAGGGNVKIQSKKPDLSGVQSKIGSKDNADHKPGGGTTKIETKKMSLDNVKSKVGSMDNAKHSPGGGDKKIESKKLDWKAQSKVGSMDNAKHTAGGGDKKIESQKLNFSEKASSKVGSMDNAQHKPGGGDKLIDAE